MFIEGCLILLPDSAPADIGLICNDQRRWEGSVAPPVDSSCNPIADTLCTRSRMRLRMIGKSHGSQIRISLFNKCQYFFIFSNFTICHSSTSFLPSCVDYRVFIYILFRVHCTIRPQIRAMIRYILFRSCFFLQGALYVPKLLQRHYLGQVNNM